MDIAFSDHFVAVSTLRQLGAVLKEIRTNIADRELGNAVFLHYVANKTPQIMSYTPVAEHAQAVDQWYGKISTIVTVWLPGIRNGPPGRPRPAPWWAVIFACTALIALLMVVLRR